MLLNNTHLVYRRVELKNNWVVLTHTVASVSYLSASLNKYSPRHLVMFWKVQQHFLEFLTTDDECTRHATLATCNQLVQSVLKIGFALAKKVG